MNAFRQMQRDGWALEDALVRIQHLEAALNSILGLARDREANCPIGLEIERLAEVGLASELKAGIESARTQPLVDLGDFTKYAKDEAK